NPAMRTARDVSVLVLSALVESTKRRWTVCDAMAATGARGLRFANEVPDVKVQLNDANPESIQLAQRNAKQLGLENVDFRWGRLEPHLAAETYDWVDIDPYGTPAPFIDVAIHSVLDGGVLAVTATDTATLSGVYPDACRRRYNAQSLRGACMPELATRILSGAVVRAAGRRDRAATPLLAYATQHFVRVYCRIDDGAAAADAQQEQLKYAVFHPDGNRGFAAQPPAMSKSAGPLWSGPLSDPGIVKKISALAAGRTDLARETPRLIAKWVEEANAPGLYFDVDDFTSGRRLESPRIEAWLDELRARNFVATRTHFAPRGIKTDARYHDVLKVLESMQPATSSPKAMA
ncbi:MAG TPA: methyltransferase domain-containing protein, partial [Candidatus Thermoplasmatota archaeon]|nr:methyltransferase domain-containing protein [Candidatus Thermoplasmatota archaeon]